MGFSKSPSAFRVGETVDCDGFFTKARFVRSQPGSEIETRLGYRSGRFSRGWWLLFMLDKPTPDEFEFRGYTYMSGGIVQGHLPGRSGAPNAEQRLEAQGHDMLRQKEDLIQNVFSLSGPERLAKAVPIHPEFGANDYPPGSGFPQWTLTTQKPFRIAAFISPGDVYLGDYR